MRWVDNQQSRWGSCTPSDRSIRLSSRLQGMPAWVVDYVLVHELAHLLEPGHDAALLGVGRPLPAGRAGQGLPARLLRGRPPRAAAVRDPRPCSSAEGSLARRESTSSVSASDSSAREAVRASRARDRSTSSASSGLGTPAAGHQRTSSDSSLTGCSAPVGGDGDEAHVEVVDAAARVAERHGVLAQLHRHRVEHAARRSRTPRWPRAAPRRPGSRRRARSGRRAGTTAGPWRAASAAPRSPSADTTRVLAVRWSG